jgi:hypothetical protein
VLDAGWGALFGVLIPVGLLASLPSGAGMQQLAVVAVSIAVAAVAGQAWRWFVFVAILTAIVALRPPRFAVPRFRPWWPLAALALVPCGSAGLVGSPSADATAAAAPAE